MKRPRDRDFTFPLWLRVAFASGTYLAIAGTFLITWFKPYTFDERGVHKLTFVMIVEFLVVHSTGFYTAFSSTGSSMGPFGESRMFRRMSPERAAQWRRGLSIGLLSLFYLLFAAAFSVSYGGPWPIFAFLGVSLPRLPALIRSGNGDADMFRGMATWAAMTVLYLGGAGFTLMANIPPLGVTPDVIAAQQFGVGGEWPEQPYRVLAFGAIYFTGLALVAAISELLDERRNRKVGAVDRTASVRELNARARAGER